MLEVLYLEKVLKLGKMKKSLKLISLLNLNKLKINLTENMILLDCLNGICLSKNMKILTHCLLLIYNKMWKIIMKFLI